MTINPSASLFTFPRFQAFNTAGSPLAGGQLYSYAAGTLTPQATYTDSSLTIPNPNPVILDAFGTASVWLGNNAYKINLLDVNGVQQANFPMDNISSIINTIPAGIVKSTGTNLTVATAGTDYISPSALIGASGSAEVGYEGTASGEVLQTVYTKLVQKKSIWDFMTATQIADCQTLNPTLDLSTPLANAAAWIGTNFSTGHAEILPVFRLVFPAGIYQYSVSPNWAYNDIEVVAEGKVIFRYTGIGDAIILDSAANGGHGVYGITFGHFIVEAPTTSGCGARINLIEHSHIELTIKGAGLSSSGTTLPSGSGWTASFATNQMTVQNVGGTNTYIPIGATISAVGVAAGTTITGIVSGTPNSVNAIYSLSTTPGVLATRSFTFNSSIGIYVTGCVCCQFNNPSVSNNDGFYGWYSSIPPSIGMYFGVSSSPSVRSSDNIIYNPIMESVSGIGIWISQADYIRILQGTCESITGVGIWIDYGCLGTKVDGTDLEANSNFDMVIAGNSSVIHGITAAYNGNILVVNGAIANVISEGAINKITFQAGSTVNILDSIRVNSNNSSIAGSWLTDNSSGHNYIGKVVDTYQGLIGFPFTRNAFSSPGTLQNNAQNSMEVFIPTGVTGLSIVDQAGNTYVIPVTGKIILNTYEKLIMTGTATAYWSYI